MRLQFNLAREFAGFTKTRYAPFEVHRDVVALLRLTAPYMERFEVIDGSGYWDDGDDDAAREKFAAASASALDDDDGPPPEVDWGGVPDLADGEDEPEHDGGSPGREPYR